MINEQVRIIGPRHNKKLPNEIVINTTSSKWPSHKIGVSGTLSPFLLGPVSLKPFGVTSKTMENAWQYCKVYKGYHDDKTGEPIDEYWIWANEGWSNPRAVRYPMGKGAKPLYSLWGDKKLDYIKARKQIYIPLYRDAVKDNIAFKNLQKLVKEGKEIALWDFDGYDHNKLGMSLDDVIHCADKKMGHAFVLKMMLMYGKDFKVRDVK